jgi:uncharacterized protein (DUF433 family)
VLDGQDHLRYDLAGCKRIVTALKKGEDCGEEEMSTNGPKQTVVRTERGLTISGTRITLYDIMGYLEDGWPPHLIQQWLGLTDPQSYAAFAYIDEHRAEVEGEYRVVLEQAEAVRAYWEDRNRERLERMASLPDTPGKEEIVKRLRTWKLELESSI